MNSAQQKTLERVFITPTTKNLAWRDIEALFLAIGCEIFEGNGSRVAFRFGTIRVDFHRPHPNKEAKPYQIRDARNFLTIIGFLPQQPIKEE